jgi:hypothetical protein
MSVFVALGRAVGFWPPALLVLCLALSGCNGGSPEEGAVKGTIMRYNQLVSEGYRKADMNRMQEVTTREQAEKLYYHMAALGEVHLRMDSTLKDITFLSIVLSAPDQASAETREIWDFTQQEIKTGKVFAQEKDFVYRMGYLLKKSNGRWMVSNANTIEGKSTNTVVPWPKLDRKGAAHPGN